MTLNKGINPASVIRLFSVLNPIMEQLGKSKAPETIHRKLVAFHRPSNKTFEIDNIPKEIQLKELEYVIILKASYKSITDAKEFLKLDITLDKI